MMRPTEKKNVTLLKATASNATNRNRYDGICVMAIFFISGVVMSSYSSINASDTANYVQEWVNNPLPNKVVWNPSLLDGLGLKLPSLELPHEWVDDIYRQPLVTVHWESSERILGLYLPNCYFWGEMGLLMAAQGAVAIVSSIVVYYTIVLDGKKQKQQQQQQQQYQYKKSRNVFYDYLPFLVGSGFIIPFWCWFPSYLVSALKINNLFMRFSVAAVTPSVCIFRTTEALGGQTNQIFTKSLFSYVQYYSLPFTPEIDKTKIAGNDKINHNEGQFIKASNDFIWNQLWKSINNFLLAGALYSACDCFPKVFIQIGPSYDLDQWYSLGWTFSGQGVWVKFVSGLIFLFTMRATGEMGLLASALFTGYQYEPYFNNPMNCHCATDFWSKQWNLMIQRLLKNGVYKPFAKFATFGYNKIVNDDSRLGPSNVVDPGKSNNTKNNHNRAKRIIQPLCLFFTFLVSGLYHEWLVYTIFSKQSYYHNDDVKSNDYPVLFGGANLLFIWQGFVLVMERLCYPKSWFHGGMPIFFKAFFLYFAGLPASFFFAPYIHTTFVRDSFSGFLTVHPVVLV